MDEDAANNYSIRWTNANYALSVQRGEQHDRRLEICKPPTITHRPSYLATKIMMIQFKSTGEKVEVFGIYWVDEEAIFSVSPKDYLGLMSVKHSEVIVIDTRVNLDFIFFDPLSTRMSGIWYSPIIEERLLDDLNELDRNAYARLAQHLGREP